jgi:hypothetical protein
MSRRVFIIGAPRSGTTWIAKMFDAHPKVIYRHEPDSAFPNPDIPGIVPHEEIPRYIVDARAYVDRLFQISSVKTSTSRPSFPKEYRGNLGTLLNSGCLNALRLLESFRPIASHVNRICLPDFIRESELESSHLVVKSVIAMGRSGLYVQACPDYRFIVIIRHPAGYVSSVLRGVRLGRFSDSIPKIALSRSTGAIERGIQLSDFEAMTDIERYSWFWVLLNEHMLREVSGQGNCLVINYETVCDSPLEWANKLYAHAQIPISNQTRLFLENSQKRQSGESGFYSVFKDATDSAQKWRSELDSTQIDVIRSITRATTPGERFWH